MFLSVVEHCRALASRFSTLAFLDSERLSQFGSILQAIHMIWPRSRLIFCQSLPRPHISSGRFLFHGSKICESFPRIWQTSVGIDSPIIVDTFLHDVQISVSFLVTSTYFSGIGNVSSWGTQSWTRDRWSHLGSTRSRQRLQRHLLILSVETLPVRLESSTEIFAPYRLFPPWSGFSEFVVSSWQFCCSICYWEYDVFSLFVIPVLLSRWFFEDEFLMRPKCPILPDPQSVYLLFKLHPRSMHTQERFLVKLSCQINWWSLDWSRAESDNFQPLPKRNHGAFTWFSESPFIMSFPIFQEVLDISQKATAFHRIGPPLFIQSWLYQYCWVPSFTLRTALSAMPFCLGSMRCRSSMIPW